MRLVFAGTPPFAARALAALSQAGHEVVLVLTQPDRPAGRGMRLTESAVARCASERGLQVAKLLSLKDAAATQLLASFAPEVMVVAAYGLLLPRSVLDVPKRGCLNIHASLLPRWRGAAPIQRALLAGDPESGVCIMRMEEGLDTGPVLLERRLRIGAEETTGTLTEALAALGAEAIVRALAHLDELSPVAQDPSRVTYAPKISKEDARIDWNLPAAQIERQIRALNPAPGAETTLEGKPLKIWRARVVPGDGRPGRVLHSRDSKLVITCISGALELLEIQRPGARRMTVSDYLRGSPIDEGAELGNNSLASH